jgi:hypothetical protein
MTRNERFPQPTPGHRDWYAFEALRALPRIVLMIDKNPFSATYGCFDREYWHYRTVDFPCGMNQEFCLALALAHSTPFPNNPYYQNTRLKELAVAAIEFARSSSHADGSCDDYFPFERALGALVFTLYAMTETYQVLGLDRPDLVEFFELRANWLKNHEESGQLSNHQALAALALYNVFLLTGDASYREASDSLRDLTLSWQSSEGWFKEYEGADPGYHSCTIDFLAKLWQKSKDDRLLEPLGRAIDFASHFMHPDGSYAGEYGSRNTYHFYPHGFEVMASRYPIGGRIAQTFLERSMPERRRYYNDDNRMCAHYVYDWMQAWIDWQPARQEPLEASRAPFTRYFPEARLFVKKTAKYYAVVSLAKGGVIKVFDEDGPVYSDTGLTAQTSDGGVLVSHLVDPQNEVEVDLAAGRMRVGGVMARRRQQFSSPVKQAAFRAMNLTIGRVSGNLVRKTVQRVLITGKPRTEVRYVRSFVFGPDEIVIQDVLELGKGAVTLERLAIGSDATSMYVANSNVFQESVLLPWVDLSEHVPSINATGRAVLPERRVLARGSHSAKLSPPERLERTGAL